MAELIDIMVDSCESEEPATPGMERILALVDAKKVQAEVVAKLDRLAR